MRVIDSNSQHFAENVVISVVSEPDHYSDYYKVLQQPLFPTISDDVRQGSSRAASQQVIEITDYGTGRKIR